MSFLWLGDRRLRLRCATWFCDGIRDCRWYERPTFTRHVQLRRWEITFDKGPKCYTASGRSFTWALTRAIAGVYRRAWARGAV